MRGIPVILFVILLAGRVVSADEPPMIKKVLVVYIDPIIESERRKHLSEVLNWNDPEELSREYLKVLNKASGGSVKWEVFASVELDLWPKKIDGFSYTDETFLKMWERGQGQFAHKPDAIDYEALIDLPLKQLDGKSIHQLVVEGEVDEVNCWGFPGCGFWESQMVGRDAYWCNSGGLQRDSRLYVVMGMNYERGVAEAVHSFGHRAESIIKHVFGSWSDSAEVNHLWDRFTRVASMHEGAIPGVGNIHFPPNGEADYNYDNTAKVDSEADLWLRYPDLDGKVKKVSARSWGGPDFQLNYLIWWLERLPNAPGKFVDDENPINDGKLNNWWKYIADMNEYPESRGGG